MDGAELVQRSAQFYLTDGAGKVVAAQDAAAIVIFGSQMIAIPTRLQAAARFGCGLDEGHAWPDHDRATLKASREKYLALIRQELAISRRPCVSACAAFVSACSHWRARAMISSSSRCVMGGYPSTRGRRSRT